MTTSAFSDRQKARALLVWRTGRDMALAFLIGIAASTILQPPPAAYIAIPLVAFIVFFQFAFADRGPNSEWALFGWRPFPVGVLPWLLLAIGPMAAFAASANAVYHGAFSDSAQEMSDMLDSSAPAVARTVAGEA